MAVIKIQTFKGKTPKVASQLLDGSTATVATDVDYSSGQLQPWKKPAADTTLAGGPGIRTAIFRYNDEVWLSWGWLNGATGEVFPHGASVCLGPETSDPPNVYFTSWEETVTPSTPPRKTNLAMCGTTAQGAPIASKYLGVDVPADAPYASVTGSATTTDPLLTESRAYVFTLVTAEGEEGPPSPPSGIVAVNPGQTVTLGGYWTYAGDGQNRSYTKKRIYRTNTGTSGTQYQFVAEIPVSQTSYVDNIASSALGEVIPSMNWLPPVVGLQGIICLPNGSLAAFKGKKVYFSVPYVPHAWPDEYSVIVDYDVVALGAFGSVVLVVTKGTPYLVNAADPTSLAPERMETGQACLAPRSLVDMGTSIIYAGTDGLIQIGQGVVRNVTAEVLSPTQWRALRPEQMHSYLWNEKYVCFIGPKYLSSRGIWSAGIGGFIFDPATGDLSDLTFAASAGYRDPKTGDLYLVDAMNNDKIVKWAAHATDKYTLQWTSKEFQLDKPTSFAWGHVQFDSLTAWELGSITVSFFAYGTNTGGYTRTVDPWTGPFRLPPGLMSDKWKIMVQSTYGVRAVMLADTIEELKGV